jgi:predicted oxidoreductase
MAVALYVIQDSNEVIVVGAGLAGLVAATEIADAGKRVLILDQEPQQSLGGMTETRYAAGEAAGFGGGGVHGYRALEGTFLGGCLLSGRNAGRAAAAACV